MSQEIRCPNCGTVSVPGETFCGECGTRLPVAPPPTPLYTPVGTATPTTPPSGGTGGLVTFLRGSGLLVGIIFLIVALLFCGCGGLLAISQPPPETSGMSSSESLGYTLGYSMAPLLVCCLPGALLAVIGVLIALFPFAFGRGK